MSWCMVMKVSLRLYQDASKHHLAHTHTHTLVLVTVASTVTADMLVSHCTCASATCYVLLVVYTHVWLYQMVKG